MKTSKKIFGVLFTALMCMCIVFALGTEAEAAVESGKCGKNLTWTLDGKGLLTISGTGKMTEYSVYNDSLPGWIGETGERVKTVVINEGVTSIGRDAFRCCTNLEKVTLPKTLKSIGVNAFYLCKSLEQIKIPDSVTAINDYAFMYCYELTDVTLSNKLAHIGESAFYMSSITEIDIPGTLKSINGFGECGNLKTVTLHEGSETIEEGAFGVCMSLETINIPSTIKTIGDWAFHSCYNLKITLPETVVSIGDYAFAFAFDSESSTVKILNPNCQIFDSEKTISNGKIIGYANSTAEAYANKYGKDFTAIKAKKLSFLRDTYTYNGGRKTPTVVIKDSQGKTLVEGTDYTYTYETDRKSVGAHTIKVTFKGNYRGTKTMTYYVVPKATSQIDVESDTDSLEIEWAKVKGADGYRVFLYKNGKEVAAKRTTKLEYEFDDLTPGTKYEVKVRAYMTIDGERIYAVDDKTVATATKPTKPTLTVTAGKGKAELSWTKKNCTNYQIRYSTDKDFDNYEYITVKGSKNISTTIENLAKGKTYYFKVRAYKSVDGVRYYGEFSKVKSVTVK